MASKIRKNKPKIGRNDPCPCGSGKKYKRCCLNKNRTYVEDILSEDTDSTENLKIRDNPSFQKFGKAIDGAKAAKFATDLGFFDTFKTLGVDLDVDGISENLTKMIELEEDFELLANINDRFNEHFLERGWIAHESSNFGAMKKAVELADNGEFEKAEQVLIDGYDEHLEILIRIIKSVDEFRLRSDLIQKAFEDYKDKRYHSCIPVIFSVIDGVVADINEIGGNKGFFAEGEDNDIYAWDSIAAHQTGLNQLRKLLYQNRGKTTTGELDIPYRNGIVHGRDLGYANKKVAVKTWATLLALKDGLISIRINGKEPKEPEKLDLMKTLKLIKENEVRTNLLKEWKPRELKINVDFPESGNPSDYQKESPEKSLVEFLEYWKNDNWGKIVEKLNYRFFEEDTLGKKVFELKTGIFKDKKLKDYSIINIYDDSPEISDIKVNLTIQNEDNEISKDINFKMLYEKENGDMELRGMKNGSWKIYKGIYDISDL